MKQFEEILQKEHLKKNYFRTKLGFHTPKEIKMMLIEINEYKLNKEYKMQ